MTDATALLREALSYIKAIRSLPEVLAETEPKRRTGPLVTRGRELERRIAAYLNQTEGGA